jgi:hypothetical protein
MNGSWMIQVNQAGADYTYQGIVSAIQTAEQIEDAVKQRLENSI